MNCDDLKDIFCHSKISLQFAPISASYKTPWRPLMKMKAPSLGSELSSASSTSSSLSSFRSSSSTSSSPWSSSPSTSLARRSLRTTWTRTRSLASTLLLGQGKARSPQVLIPFLPELLKCKIKLTLYCRPLELYVPDETSGPRLEKSYLSRDRIKKYL